jgi:hypothetical protein
VPVFYGTSSDSFRWFVGATLLAYGPGCYALGSLLPGGVVFGWLFLAAGLVALYRLLTRRVWVFNDRRVELHGFWYSWTGTAKDVIAVTYVPYVPLAKSFEGHRLYVSVRDQDGARRALCISSNMREWTARRTADGLLDATATYSGADRLSLTESRLAPNDASRGWVVAARRIRAMAYPAR